MRVALLADVHGNLPALQAVMAHARGQAADEFWNLGDMVGYGPFPDECIKILLSSCRYNLLGNHDQKALLPDTARRMSKKGKDPDKIFAFDWAHRHCSRDALDLIRGLLPARTETVAGRQICLTHGSPLAINDGITPDSSRKELLALAQLTLAKLILCGHTHAAFDREVRAVRFINPGAVGRPFDGDPRASYCLLDISQRSVQVVFARVEYDLPGLVRAMSAREFPSRIIRSFLQSRHLDDIKE